MCFEKERQDNKSTFTGICQTNNLVSAGRNKESPFLRKEPCLVGMHPCSFTIFIDLDRYPHTQTLYSGREQRNVQNMKDWLHMEIAAGIKACRHGHNYSSEKGHDSNCGFIPNSFSKNPKIVCYNQLFKVWTDETCLNAVEVPSCWPSAHCMNEMSLHTRWQSVVNLPFATTAGGVYAPLCISSLVIINLWLCNCSGRL